ncbi:MAG TPA: hypothetical protein PKN54_08385 [Candidatus Cloacimonas acidaminovorans]|nr:MAG: hypothetical protein BWY51_00825 [Parcubacteria group bacterium ADurb.Bin316]HNV62953.1 hypothetical protein [Candidatus Cloacimonas acidaminovorans]
MKVLTEGHLYELENFESKDAGQNLQFIHKEPKEAGSTELVTIADGTTNEDVLAVIIDRLKFLQSKFPCRENDFAISKLEEALMWLEKRTNDRLARGVEGKQIS